MNIPKIDLTTFNPCNTCKFKQFHGRCPMERKTMCNAWYLVKHLSGENKCTVTVPDEVFIEILRERGYHGELKKSEVVTI